VPPPLTFEKAGAPVEEEIERLVRGREVVLFMKGTRRNPMCGFSGRVVGALEELGGGGLEFDCVDCLDEEGNPGLRQGIKDYSQWPTIPQLYVRGEFVGGADIVGEMVASGELQKVLRGE